MEKSRNDLRMTYVAFLQKLDGHDLAGRAMQRLIDLARAAGAELSLEQKIVELQGRFRIG